MLTVLVKIVYDKKHKQNVMKINITESILRGLLSGVPQMIYFFGLPMLIYIILLMATLFRKF